VPNPVAVDAGLTTNLAGVVADDGALQVTTGWGMVRAMDGPRQRPLWARWLGRDYITAVDVSPDGRSVVVGDWRGRVFVLRRDDGVTAHSGDIIDDAIVSIAALPGGRMVIGTANGVVAGVALASAPE